MKMSLSFAVLATLASANAAAEYRVPRLADGTPDLQGVWTNATATPMERAPALGNRRAYTPEEVAKVEGTARARVENDAKPTDPSLKIAASSSLPPVGNYNQFWTDRGMSVATIDGEKRTSVIIDPPNGRIPPLTADDDTNWLLDRAPDVYFYGVLLQANAWDASTEAAANWKGLWDEAIDELRSDGARRKWGAGPISPRIRRA